MAFDHANGARSSGGKDSGRIKKPYNALLRLSPAAAQKASRDVAEAADGNKGILYLTKHPVDLIILNTQDGFTRTMLLIQATVWAPILEELTFRGLLFNGLSERWGFRIGAGFPARV